MSYDFDLFTPQQGVEPSDIVFTERDEIERGSRNPAIEAKKKRVADALIAHDARLELFTPDFDEIARLHKMSPAEAHDRMRRLELNDAADATSGIQIMLFDDRASLTIPYWHKGETARRVLTQAWGYFDIVCRECGYEVFDQQLDRMIDVNAFDEVLRTYESVTARMDDMIGRAPKKPWWKFW
jgi:hypothetical protein